MTTSTDPHMDHLKSLLAAYVAEFGPVRAPGTIVHEHWLAGQGSKAEVRS